MPCHAPLREPQQFYLYSLLLLTDNSALVVLIGVELAHDGPGRQVVVGLLDHVAAVGNLALLKRALVDVDVRVVLQIHYFYSLTLID